MEPISALSFACNIIDLLERGIKAGAIIKEIYQAPDGLRKHDKALLDQPDTLSVVTAGLRDAQGRITDSPVDARMKEVAAKCSALCVQMEAVVDKCRPKKADSVVSATNASARALWYRSEMESLEAELEKGIQMLMSLVATATL